ncbi:MAG: undecaprenyldiphospho-muramoylpentapeptide beta-N-acetylglucosaminyltransferase [Clostridiales bacterium]|jgi:UDP-N-acetylglucosamine--N-acetylmuramyl-(pentapeptide) pyrophosphoryl-undecaprenol N-acetylglucosamine transferase|nr:undecaprenyldiphospho-muramoylpentapeptide beta-N-acetylglucosaminyltransferase [Clostridiales bacterium]
MKIVLSGGGTGGHVNPALAIAGTVKAHEPDSEISYIGTPKGIENKLVPLAGYPLYHVEIQGLKRSISLSNLKTAWLTLTSVNKAKKLLLQIGPDVVVGTGGYACWPVVKAAGELGIPTALHESNAIPGFAVKMLEKDVNRIFINFEETKKALKHPEKAERVGNPMRGAFEMQDRKAARRELGIAGDTVCILSYGGSMGAEQVNNEILAVMRDYTSKEPNVRHLHATGAIEWPIASVQFNDMGLDKFPNLSLVEYIYNMPREMAAADIVICRAGAMTLSELALMKKACILIPSPNVADNHQYKNAKVLADKGAALVFQESELTEGKLAQAIRSLASDPGQREKMADNISQFAVNDASERIYAGLSELINKTDFQKP